MRIGILLTNGKHLHDDIISQRDEVWDHKTSLIPPLCFYFSACSKPRNCAIMHMCIMGIYVAYVYTILLLEFGTVPTLMYLVFIILFISIFITFCYVCFVRFQCYEFDTWYVFNFLIFTIVCLVPFCSGHCIVCPSVNYNF